MRMREVLRPSFFLFAAGLAGFYGCSSSSSDAGPSGPAGGGGSEEGGAGSGGAGGAAGSDAGGTDAKTDGKLDAGPDNHDFSTAAPLTIGSSVSGTILKTGSSDYWKLDAHAGQWLVLYTVANAADDPTKLDTVIGVYDSTQKLYAEDDDAHPRASTDSQLFTLIPADGTYYVKVQDYATWNGDPASTGGTYKLYVDELFTTTSGNVLDKETGNDAASATPLTYPSNAATLLYGTFADGADVDVFSFTLPTQAADRVAQFWLQPSGSKGNGSATTPGDVWITDPTGGTVYAKIDATQPNLNDLAPRLDGTLPYLLWVKHPATAAASPEFYFALHQDATENPLETEALYAGTNDTIAGAEALALTPSTSNAKVSEGYIAGSISFGAPPGDGGAEAGAAGPDVDYFSFPATSGSKVVVGCGAMRSGSGLVSAALSLRSSTDTSLGASTETAATDLVLGDTGNEITVPSDGTYYLRLTAASQDPVVVGNWYRCGVRVTAP